MMQDLQVTVSYRKRLKLKYCVQLNKTNKHLLDKEKGRERERERV
jgi:hypothetical protein